MTNPDAKPPTSTERSNLERKVSRQLKLLQRRIAEADTKEVQKQVDIVKSHFEVFEKYHEKYHATLEDSTEMSKSEQYFCEVEQLYIDVLNEVKDFMLDAKQYDGVCVQQKMIQMLDNQINLPHLVLDVFNGDDVLEFPGWLSSFDESIDSKDIPDHTKLSLMLQFTGSKAKGSIKHCQTDKKSGYKNARKILSQRFGAPHLIAFKTKENLRNGPKISSGEDLLQFSNDLDMAYSTVKNLNLDGEMNTQSSIKEILCRCPKYLQAKYNNYSTDYVAEKSKYPGFKEFTDFIRKWAKKQTDPVWSTLEPFEASETTPVGSASCIYGSGLLTKNDEPKHEIGPEFRPQKQCHLCGELHLLYQCCSFRTLSPTDRCKLVTDMNLCNLCFSANHSTDDCVHEFRCTVLMKDGSVCGRKHSRLLHSCKTSSDDLESPYVPSGSTLFIQKIDNQVPWVETSDENANESVVNAICVDQTCIVECIESQVGMQKQGDQLKPKQSNAFEQDIPYDCETAAMDSGLAPYSFLIIAIIILILAFARKYVTSMCQVL